MKRQKAAIVLPCAISWTFVVTIAAMFLLSCACKNKSSHVEKASSAPATAAQTIPSVDPAVLEKSYGDLVKAVRAKDGYSNFAEFLERGRYLNTFMRQDILRFVVLAPSDKAFKALSNQELTNLIYPDMHDQSHLDFFHRHVAFGAIQAEGYRTFSNKTVNLHPDNKKITLDGKEIKVLDDAVVSPSIKLLFIENLIN